MRFAAIAACLVAAAVAQSALAQRPAGPKKIQCWTDDKGQRMCGDRVPPEYADRDRQIMKGGRVVETKEVLTPEEQAQAKAKKKAEDDARREAEQRAKYDRALLETFRSADDIVKMRDERLALVDSRITALEKNSADTDKGLQDLRARAAAATKDGKPLDKKLEQQIKQFEKSQAQNQRALERNKIERASIVEKFGSDLARYQELKGIKSPPTPVAAPGATAAPPPMASPAKPAAPPPSAAPAKAGG